MPCYRVPGGIICTRVAWKPTPKCPCGNERTLECDWRLRRFVGKRGAKLKTPRLVTCDAPLCESCAYHPTEGKDLCAAHAAKWRERCAAEAEANRSLEP